MKYFSMKELTATTTGKPNEPNDEQRANLENLVNKILDPARDALNFPITVSSGFRSPEVNATVGGAATSQHTKGEAADCKCCDTLRLFEYIRTNHEFDQLIWEFGDTYPQWVHVSLKRGSGNRKEVLRAKKVNGRTVYEKY